jgi:hypothetical protein
MHTSEDNRDLEVKFRDGSRMIDRNLQNPCKDPQISVYSFSYLLYGRVDYLCSQFTNKLHTVQSKRIFSRKKYEGCFCSLALPTA